MSHREITGASEDARCESSEELDVVDIDPASFRPEGVYHLTGRLTAVMSGELQPSKKGRLTPNIKALIVTAVLFTTITLAQVAAARIANSQALLMDCISGLTATDLPDNDVNGNITLAFGAGGVVFDILSLWAFCHSRRKEGHAVNMFTALLHVGADFLRSVSTVVMILVAHVESTCLDAYTSIVIGVSIICGAFWGFLSLAKLV
ncbi:unnamed protein product, partial [Symbiodinium microadriaticum]